jgi:hypothetical protein
MRHIVEDVLVAGLRLRFGAEVVQANLYVPSNAVGQAAVVVLLDDDDNIDPLGQGLSAGAKLVVVRVPARAQLLAALYWVADHANERGGRSDRVMVAGRAESGARAAWLAIEARDAGWPVLHAQVLVHPRFTRCCAAPHRVTGVAPATIVSGSAPRDEAAKYAVLLKRSGVVVRQLRRSAPDDEMRMVADLGRALQQTKERMP